MLYQFKVIVFLVFTALAGFVYTPSAIAQQTATEPDLSQEHFQDWLLRFRNQAQIQGISAQTLDTVLVGITLNEKVIKLDRKQPDLTKSFKEYREMMLPKARIKHAKRMYEENKPLLDKIGKEYGVQPRFIVALWGIESNFGKNMGGFPIIESLATLAYEGRHTEFFKDELMKALKIIDEGHISAEDMKGSWAGAMGQTQFMPSSFLSMAVDYNKDGKKDIWNTKEDVFASIANYLHVTGWSNAHNWGRKVEIPKKFDKSLIDIKKEKTLNEWHKLGLRKADGGKLPAVALTASLIKPDSKGHDVFLVYRNYKTIMDWNRSLYFATIVGMLSDAIGEAG